MTDLLTAAQMRETEQAAIGTGRVTGLALMERAGRGAVAAIEAEWPDLGRAPGRAVVFCGPGNNGGDGFVVARLLLERGWAVEVFLHGNAEKLPPDARTNHERWSEIGEVAPFEAAPSRGDAADLFVDALFGTGLTRPLDGALFDWAVQQGADPVAPLRTVALDMPSGLCSDSGRELAAGTASVRAALTVTFHAAKQGHFLDLGPARCGRLVVADIGLRPSGVAGAELIEADPGSLAKHSGHKFDHGHALVLSGGVGRGGAARMAARGALRVGAGLVTLGCPPAALIENAARLDAIMLRPVADGEALTGMLADDRLNALCLGPGLGTGAREAALVRAALAARRATVLDGDALTLLAGDADLMGALHDRCVLTPHGGEFARLFPDIAGKLDAAPIEGPAYSKIDAARAAAAGAGCVVLFKGPDTVIADPIGRAAISSAQYHRAAPWLATAGAGDVLAGLITGLLARGAAPMTAAGTAAWLHVECACAFGPGLIAEDLPEMLPRVLRAPGP